MSTKNRTIRNFIELVTDYSRTKSDRYEANIQRCLQVVCSMENLAVFDMTQPDIVEFFLNLVELLKSCDFRSGLGWKAVEAMSHLATSAEIRSFLQQLEAVPVVSAFFCNQTDADKSFQVLKLLETLTDSLTVHRSGLWLGALLKNVTERILDKTDGDDDLFGLLLTVLSNLCLENDVVINQLQRESRCDELLQRLMQLQPNDHLIQLHAAQVVFSCLAIGSINESLLGDYLGSVVDLLMTGVKNNSEHVIQRCTSILMWMSRDQLLVEMIHSAPLQQVLDDCLQMLVPRLLEHGAGGGASGAELTTSTVNTVLQFLARLLRSNLLAATKLPETLLLQLVPLLEDVQVQDNLLELLSDLLRTTPSLNLMDQTDFEPTMQTLVLKMVQLLAAADQSASRLVYALQILQKLYKLSTLNARITSALRPDAFIGVVTRRTDADAKDAQVPSTVAGGHQATRVVVEALTLLGQIACRGGEWLQSYSFLLGQSGVQRCLATAILHGDCQLKQSSLALVGTLGFSADSVVGLSQSLDQLSPAAKPCASDVPRAPSSSGGCAAADEAAPKRPLTTVLAPAQAHKLDQLMARLRGGDGGKLWDSLRHQNDVVELMELRMDRMAREEQRLKAEVDGLQQELCALRLGRLQVETESSRLMTALLNKNDQLQQKEAQQRALVRRLEHVQQQLGQAEATWIKERQKLAEERDRLGQEQAELVGQHQTQLDALRKQSAKTERQWSHRLDEVQMELQEALKTAENLRALARKRDKELESLHDDLKDSESTCEGLRQSLKKKEKECEERAQELSQVRQTLKCSEKLTESLESKLLEADRQCKETRAELVKLEKIREFIHDISGGKKKLCEE